MRRSDFWMYKMKKRTLILLLAIGTNAFGQVKPKTATSSAALIPAGYVVFQKIQGDLNKDNQIDDILIIKDTKKSNFEINRFGEKVDRNPRGIIIAFKNQDQYELVLENRNCFSSENEDGGVYFAPELNVEANKGNLLIHYGHGRYGYWSYIFRYQNADFELIGYDSSQNRGPTVERSTSINLSTQKMRIRENLNPTAEGGDEKFKETWKKFTLPKPIKLREITGFDDFQIEKFLGKIQ